MSTHRPVLSTNEIYHVYNRTIGKIAVFDSIKNLYRILEIVNFYRFSQNVKLSVFKNWPQALQADYLNNITKQLPLIEIYVFSFMPNHFHFLLKQLQNKGISTFLSNIQNSFAKSFNLIYERDGGLFKNSFKAKRITNNEEFIHVGRYIHLNHVTSKIITIEQLLTYEWTSLAYYFDKKNSDFVNANPVLRYFKTQEKYFKFLKNNIYYQS